VSVMINRAMTMDRMCLTARDDDGIDARMALLRVV